MPSKKFNNRDGSVQVTILKDPDEIAETEEKLDVKDSALATLTPARQYENDSYGDKKFQADCQIFVMVKEESVKLVVNFDLSNGIVTPDPDMTEKELSHFVHPIQRALFVLAHDSVNSNSTKDEAKDKSDC